MAPSPTPQMKATKIYQCKYTNRWLWSHNLQLLDFFIALTMRQYVYKSLDYKS